MRRTLLALALVVLCSCVSVPPKESICVTYEPESYSWICTVTAKYGYTPEDMQGLVLDILTIEVLRNKDWDDTDTASVVEFTREVDSHVDNPAMTFDKLIQLVESDAEKSMLLLNIISRRLPWFSEVMIIPAKDRYLIHLHTEYIRRMFGVYE